MWHLTVSYTHLIERIGDHAENIVELAIQKYENNITLSYDGYKEVRQLFEVTLRSITIAIESFKMCIRDRYL